MSIDDRTPPLIVAGAPAGDTAAHLEALHAAILKKVEARARFLVVADARAILSADAGLRKRVSDFRTQHKEALGPLEYGPILMTDSRLIIGALTAVSWVSGAFNGLRTARDVEELVRAAREVSGQFDLVFGPAQEAAIRRGVS